MSTLTVTFATALGLAAGLGLGACAAAPAEPTETRNPPISADPDAQTRHADNEPLDERTATEPSAESPTAVVGAEITDPTEVVACQPGANAAIVIYGDLADGRCPLEPGQQVYVTGANVAVVVDRAHPLPAAVASEVQAGAASALAGAGSGYDATSAVVTTVESEVRAATGKTAVVVYQKKGAIGCNGTGVDPWGFTGATAASFGGCAAWATRAEALAAAQSWVDASGDPTYLVVAAHG